MVWQLVQWSPSGYRKLCAPDVVMEPTAVHIRTASGTGRLNQSHTLYIPYTHVAGHSLPTYWQNHPSHPAHAWVISVHRCTCILNSAMPFYSTPMSYPSFSCWDHFLSYCLCPPSIKDWSKSQTLAKALLSFPWLDDFATIVIDLAKDYALLHSICLQLPPK